MNKVGFKGFRPVETITNESLEKSLGRIDTDNLFVYFTGGTYKARARSLRSQSLATIIEVKTPVPVKTLLERAARISGNTGFKPEVVKSGLYLHRNSKPAVYLALERREDGAYVAATNTPYADGFSKGLKAGDIVIEAPTAKKLPAPKKPSTKRLVKAVKNATK